MKENYNDEESNSSSKKLIDIGKIDTVQSDKYIELEDKNSLERSSSSKTDRDSETSFTKQLLKKVKIEEEEENMKKMMKKTQKLINQIKSLSRKDYIVFFLILLSCGLNYNYLFLPLILLSIIYYFALESISYKVIKLKYLLEIFIIGYASYILQYKSIIYSFIKNGNNLIIENKEFYINFGVITLKDIDSYPYFFLNFLPELIIIAANGYGILVSFRSRLLKKTDTLSKNITGVRLTKMILVIYLFFVVFTYFQFSYLGLFYMICIQIIMLLNSLKFHDKIIKKILKVILNFLNFIIFIQIILTNYFNIYSIQKRGNEYYANIEKENSIINYFSWKQIGINIKEPENYKEYLLKFGGYMFSIIILMISKNVLNNLKNELDLETNININSSIRAEIKNNHSIKRLKKIFSIILSKIMQFLSHPTFNFEISRILAIAWTYFYRNIYSLGILIFIFLSFFSVHIKKNKCLVIYLLTPMLFLSLCSFHVSNIEGICDVCKSPKIDDKKDEKYNDYKEKMKYMRFAIRKYKHPTLEYWIGHLFYIIVMFLINSIYTAELKPRNIGSMIDIENNKSEKENKEEENIEKENIKEENIKEENIEEEKQEKHDEN